jgi:hypothetical protein
MKCKICQSKSIQKCFVIKPIENPASYFQSLEVQYFQCDFCHFLFSDIFDQLSECEMRNMNIKLHDTAYYAVIDPVAFRINRGYRELEMVSNYLKLQGIPKASCKVLVFGCGQGLSFNLMLQQGFDVYATDCDACDFRSVPLPGQVSAAQWLAVLKNQLINLAVRKKISKKCYDKGLANEMHERFLFQGALHNRRFGIVTMTEVMEHLIDPLETMVAITEIVEHGGFVIGTTGFVDYAESPLEK